MESPNPREVGARIKSARKAAGITQRELAESLNVTVRTVQNYEAGSTVPYRHLRHIETLTGKRPGWVLGGMDEDRLFQRVLELQSAMESHREALERHLSELRANAARLREQHRDRNA